MKGAIQRLLGNVFITEMCDYSCKLGLLHECRISQDHSNAKLSVVMILIVNN